MSVVLRAAPLLLALLLTAGNAHAQESEAAREEARQLFAEGGRAVAEGRLADARRAFRRSLELHPHPATAFNLALAAREAGAYRESLDLYDALLAEEYGALEDERRREVEEARREVRDQLGTVRVSVRGVPEAQVLVDGRVVDRVAAGATLEVTVDPGEHAVAARAGGRLLADRVVQVGRGAATNVSIEAAPPPAAPPSPAARNDEGGSVLASPWLWIGVAIAVAAGVGLTALWLAEDEPPSLPEDLVFGEVMTLRW